ncbi:MAG: glycosyltransferase [Candidatus Scalinduaceae bacterium]
MKVSVILVDGGFRENIHAARCFSEQDFPKDEYEVIWVEYYRKPHEGLKNLPKVKVLILNNYNTYHSSYCFNAGIREASGKLLIIPDADQIVPSDFISRVWNLHKSYDKLVVYGYRYDEIEQGVLKTHSLDELEKKCVLKNPTNYGGCLTVRRKWLIEINGYEQHPLLGTGNHSNGLDIYTRFRNLGLAIQWAPTLKLYHPWHSFSRQHDPIYDLQLELIEWKSSQLFTMAFEGINSSKNIVPTGDAKKIIKNGLEKLTNNNQQLQHENQQLKQEIEQLQQENQQTKQEILQIRNSLSLKITAPLRKIYGLIRNF